MKQLRAIGACGWLLPLALLGACGGGGKASSSGPAPNVGWWTTPPPPSTGGAGAGSGSGAGVVGPGSSGGNPVTVSGNTGSSMAPHLPGGGVTGNTALAPGCTPASAEECPSLSGACATGAGAQVTVTKFGTLCFAGEMSTLNLPASTIEYILETTNGQTYYHFRVTMSPYFVDNTYGSSSIGWPPVRGHRYGDLVKSDHTELQLFDAGGTMTLHFKMDYITELASRSCGYGTLGVHGGDGSMIVGNPAWVLNVGTSLDRNLNACGYCMSPACPGGDCRVNSPTTDDKFSTNPEAPKWDFRLVYDVWIDPAAFGSSGFGKANISYVHASPAKGGSDTIYVSSKECPPNWDHPYTPPSIGEGGGSSGTGGSGGSINEGGGTNGGGACPVNYQEYLTSEGKSVCVPNATPTPGGGYSCPVNWMVFVTSEGKATCIPAPSGGTGSGGGSTDGGAGGGGSGGSGGGGSGTGVLVPVGSGGTCPVNYEIYVSSEGKSVCLPIGTGTGGKGPGKGTGGTAGGVGVPVGAGGTCPINYEVYVATEGAQICLPTGTTGGAIPAPDGGICPTGYMLVKAIEGGGAMCEPITGGGGGGTGSGTGTGGGTGGGGSCPIDWTLYVTSEGQASCTPTPRGNMCPIDWTTYLTSEGKTTCVPTPRNGVCPDGYKYDISSEGRFCL